MAKLISPYPGITIYKDKNGKIIARAKPGHNKKMKTHPQYQRTREHGAAYGKAASCGRLIRQVFYNWASNSDTYLTSRLAKSLLTVIQAGDHENRMEPMLTNGDLSILDGFQFNAKAAIHNTFYGPWSVFLENDNKRVRMVVPAFTPQQVINNPNGGLSHFRLIPLVASVNFQSGQYVLVKGNQAEPADPVVLDAKGHKAISLEVNIDMKGDIVVLVALGIEFYWLVGEKHFTPVAAGGHNALGIIKAYKLCVS